MTDNVNTSAIQTYDPKQASGEILEVVADGLSKYLEHLGLPYENILVEIKQRQRAIVNIQEIIPDLSPKQKASAFYLSKFISASMMGLFDAALNYLWDETIQSLRSKVTIFDLNYFYDTAIKDINRRNRLKDEDDLIKLEDWELVSGCRETGIITQIGYRHLDYIRDMRNHASAAHPNHNEITGIQLASWLETCIKEVIGKEPEGAVIEVKKLLTSLREETLSTTDVSPIAEAIRKLPNDLVSSLLRSVFGMYVDPNIAAKSRSNINLIAAKFWLISSDEIRYELGIKYSSYEVNGEIIKKQRAYEFLKNVEGLSYLPQDTLALKLNEALDSLLNAHNGWHNFHTEPIPARLVQSFVPPSGQIPINSMMNYVRVLTICRIGNEYGVSNNAQMIYDDLMAKWSNDEAKCLIKLLQNDYKLRSKLQFLACTKRLKQVIEKIQINITDPLIQDILKLIINFSNHHLDSISDDIRFKEKISILNP
jgi:hypothetical protein